jgi:hypothetical protein
MSTRDIADQLQDLYGVEVSAGLISNVTEAVEEERKAWQNRALDSLYPIVYFDAIVVKVRQDGRVINKAIHLARGEDTLHCLYFSAIAPSKYFGGRSAKWDCWPPIARHWGTWLNRDEWVNWFAVAADFEMQMIAK